MISSAVTFNGKILNGTEIVSPLKLFPVSLIVTVACDLTLFLFAVSLPTVLLLVVPWYTVAFTSFVYPVI